MLQIVKYPADILETPATEIIVFDETLYKLLDEMKETMIESKGVGLAAPQVNESYRVFIVSENGTSEGAIEFINPKIVLSGISINFREGCLSFPRMCVNTKRYDNILIKYQNRYGKEQTLNARGFLAVICQHELDHLNGITLANFMNSSERRFLKKSLAK